MYLTYKQTVTQTIGRDRKVDVAFSIEFSPIQQTLLIKLHSEAKSTNAQSKRARQRTCEIEWKKTNTNKVCAVCVYVD